MTGTEGARTWRERLAPLSPLSVLLAAGFLAAAYRVHDRAAQLVRARGDRGSDPGEFEVFVVVAPLVLVVLAVITVAKDWRIATERGRVWANLVIWLGVGIVAAITVAARTAELTELMESLVR